MATAEQIRSIVSKIDVPGMGASFDRTGMLDEVSAEGDGFVVKLCLPTPAFPNPDGLKQLVTEAVRPVLDEGQSLEVALRAEVRGKDAGGRIGLKVRNIIAVGSGKGGVGKSTVAAALACGLHSFGCSVGLMDADVYGPSIPHMMNASGRPAANEYEDSEGNKFARMVPIDADGVKVISMGFFIEQGQSVVWRGPMLHKALTQFLKDTEWGELDYLIIDLPPGTGDVSLTLSQQVGLAGAVVVCTPQQVALLDAVKAVDMYQKVNVPVLGFVENMAGDVFGRGGAKKVADELQLPFLGEVPLETGIRELGDAGRMMDLMKEDNPSREPLRAMCQQVALQVAKSLVSNPTGPTLEIL